MLFPGLAMLCAGIVWAALSPHSHQAGWGVLIFVGVLVVAFSIVLWLKGSGRVPGETEGDQPSPGQEQEAHGNALEND